MHDVIEGIVGSIVCGKLWYEESPWGLVMDDMRVEGRGEHVIQPSADGANGWLIWKVSPSWLSRWVQMNVPHHGGDYGVTMRVNVLYHGGGHGVRAWCPGCDHWWP